MSTFEERQRREIEAARAKHRPINSAHEGYSVILEELDEFWEEVRKKRSERSKDRMVSELVQIAAMAQRTAEDVCMKALALDPDRGEIGPGHICKHGVRWPHRCDPCAEALVMVFDPGTGDISIQSPNASAERQPPVNP